MSSPADRFTARGAKWALGAIGACGALGGWGAAHAAITCGTMSTTSASFAYVANTNNGSAGQSGLNNVVMNTVSVTCTRDSNNPSIVRLGVANGLSPAAGTNRARYLATSNLISYNTFKDAACANALTDANNGQRLTYNMNAPVGTPELITYNFYTCIETAQPLTSFPSGSYTDTANVNLRYGSAPVDQTVGMNVTIFAPAACSISGLPATNSIALTYTALQALAAFNSVSFNANCTNQLPYSLSLDSAFGVVGGVNYQLGITLTAPGSSTALGGATATDVGGALGTKVHYINAAMAPGQAGQIGALTSNAHTLTITY